MEMNKTEAAFGRLYEIIARLRAPDGCPWDRAQTPDTMRTDLVEEAFEAVDAITQHDAPHVCEELGDVMLNAAMIAYMYEQAGDFTLAGVLNLVSDKIVRRHPHVFKESEGASEALEGGAKTAEQVLTQWDAIKRNVEGRGDVESVLDEVAEGLPPLMRAYKMQKKAAKKGFDWDEAAPAAAKVREELAELEAAAAVTGAKDKAAETEGISDEVRDHIEDEAGDLLFAAVNYIRHLGIDPSIAMARANAKFRRRFGFVEKEMSLAGLPMDQEHLSEMDAFWNKAKENEKN